MDKRQISMLYIGDGSVVEFLHKHNYQKMGFIAHFASSFAMSIALLKKERVDVVVVNSNSLKLDTLELVKDHLNFAILQLSCKSMISAALTTEKPFKAIC